MQQVRYVMCVVVAVASLVYYRASNIPGRAHSLGYCQRHAACRRGGIRSGIHGPMGRLNSHAALYRQYV